MTNAYKQDILAKRVIVIAGLFAVLGLVGCQQEGTAEKAGQKLDRSIENAERKIEGTTEKAEVKLDDAKKILNEKIEATGQYIDDSSITVNVKRAILDDPLLKVFQIKVTTVNGIVQLSGELDSQENIDKAIEVVERQKDVKSVQNDLVVKTETLSEE